LVERFHLLQLRVLEHFVLTARKLFDIRESTLDRAKDVDFAVVDLAEFAHLSFEEFRNEGIIFVVVADKLFVHFLESCLES